MARRASRSHICVLRREAHRHSDLQVFSAAQTERNGLPGLLQMSLSIARQLDDPSTRLVDPQHRHASAPPQSLGHPLVELLDVVLTRNQHPALSVVARRHSNLTPLAGVEILLVDTVKELHGLREV